MPIARSSRFCFVGCVDRSGPQRIRPSSPPPDGRCSGSTRPRTHAPAVPPHNTAAHRTTTPHNNTAALRRPADCATSSLHRGAEETTNPVWSTYMPSLELRAPRTPRRITGHLSTQKRLTSWRAWLTPPHCPVRAAPPRVTWRRAGRTSPSRTPQTP